MRLSVAVYVSSATPLADAQLILTVHRCFATQIVPWLIAVAGGGGLNC